MFRVKDYEGNNIEQRFYPEELQKITDNLHRIEKSINPELKIVERNIWFSGWTIPIDIIVGFLTQSSEMSKVCNASLIIFTVQAVAILSVIIASLINLSLRTGNQQLWTVVLTSTLGYILPSPKLKVYPNFIKSIKESNNSWKFNNVWNTSIHNLVRRFSNL